MKKTFFLKTVAMMAFIVLGSCRGNDDVEKPINQINNNEKNPNFITTWAVVGGNSTSSNFFIPIKEELKEKYNYNIKWSKIGDPTIKGERFNIKDTITINVPSGGKYKVEISGAFPVMHQTYFEDFNNANIKLLSIENWGDIEWVDMTSAFRYSEALINAKDSPNFSKGAILDYMFAESSIDVDISHWDVSNVVSMESMFGYAKFFNQPLNSWDVSNVTNMNNMFSEAKSFNQPLNSWDVSNVTDMNNMFYYARSFNQPLDSWNVSNVTDMSYMFSNAESFNQPLNSWDVSNVTYMNYMFYYARSFNQPLNSWDVSNVTDMNNMFSNARSFNQPLNSWDVSNVTYMNYMFSNAESFEQDNISSWKLSDEQKDRIGIVWK